MIEREGSSDLGKVRQSVVHYRVGGSLPRLHLAKLGH